jgi:hypothetical protein
MFYTQPTKATVAAQQNPSNFLFTISTMKVAAALVFTATTASAFAPAAFGVRCT